MNLNSKQSQLMAEVKDLFLFKSQPVKMMDPTKDVSEPQPLSFFLSFLLFIILLETELGLSSWGQRWELAADKVDPGDGGMKWKWREVKWET